MNNKIKQILLAAFPDVTLRSGKPLNDIVVEVTAAINESLVAETRSVIEKMSLANYDLMTNDEMDNLASNYLEFKRQNSQKAVGNLRVFLNERTDLVIAKNRTYFKSGTGFLFRPVFDFAIPVVELQYDETQKLYYIDILIESVVDLANDTIIEVGDVNSYVGDNIYVNRVYNFSPLVVSRSIETNFEVYKRLTENGILSNPTRKNYIGATLLNTFPDIKKILMAGTGHNLMERDLTFKNIDASSAIVEYNFFKKKSESTVDNPNFINKGFLNTLEQIEFFTPDTFEEISQSDYESVAFRDNSSLEHSTLLSHIFFFSLFGYTDLIDEDLHISETGNTWDSGSSYVKFTGDVTTGLEVKGNYITDEDIIENERGLVIYKSLEDAKNKEILLNFKINDFTTTRAINNNQSKVALTTNNTETITVSNNKPLYLSVLKKGSGDLDNFITSSYDGYGIMIMKSFLDQRPNVFIVDGSSGTGEIALEDQIIQSGSERVLAGKFIPLEAGVAYNCILQVTANYGLTAVFKDEFNSELGRISLGGGGLEGDYETIYNLEDNSTLVAKETSVNTISDTFPYKIKFISSNTDEEQCSGFLSLKFSAAASTSNDGVNLLSYFSNSKRILKLDNDSGFFNNFEFVTKGDILEVAGNKYIIKYVYDKKKIEVSEDVVLPEKYNTWIVWKDLTFNEDFSIPQKSSYNFTTILSTGVDKIEECVLQTTPSTDDNHSRLKFEFKYIQKDGQIKQAVINYTDSGVISLFKRYDISGQDNVKVDGVSIFDLNDLVINEDYFFVLNSFNKFNYIYLTQEGFNKINSKNFKVKLTEGNLSFSKEYILEKNVFQKGYQVPLVYVPGIYSITHLDKCYDTSRVYEKNIHYKNNETNITDILIDPSYYSLFYNKLIYFDCEVIGTSSYANPDITVSSLGDNKLYTDSTITGDYFTVIIDNQRYFIDSITTVSNTPFSGKNTQITLKGVAPILDDVVINMRKKYTTSTNTSSAKFGFRYDLLTPSGHSNYYVWNDADVTKTIFYGSKNLIKGDDYEISRTIPLESIFVSVATYNLLSSGEYLYFQMKKRIVAKELERGNFNNFSPLSQGSYLGIGFKNINNGHWNLYEMRIRELSEKYSGVTINLNVGRNIKNEDRIFLDLTAYAQNTNSSLVSNGMRVYIYNAVLGQWEFLFQNNSIASETGRSFLQFYDGPDVDNRKYEFGYWKGSTFITLMKDFYVTNYSDNNGYFKLLLVTNGKTDNDFSTDIVFSEAKLFLDYVNLKWQYQSGIHAGNKLDIWTALDASIKTKETQMTFENVTKSFEVDDTFAKPIIKINSIKTVGGLSIPFDVENLNKNLRFSVKERLNVVFNSEIPLGTYTINYDYIPGIAGKQNYVDSLNKETDVLIRSLVPVFVKINLAYAGSINESAVKQEIYNYIKYNNKIYTSSITSLVLDGGAALVLKSNTLPIIVANEYDILQDPIELTSDTSYEIKEEKYFEINLSDINLTKLS